MRLILLALVMLALSQGTVRAKDAIRLETEDIGVVARESDLITKSKARKVLISGRNAFAKIANHLRLTSEDIFHQGSECPIWAKGSVGKNPRIWIRFQAEVDAADLGGEAYLGRMADGAMRIHLGAFEKDLGAEDRYLLWRELTHAILAHTTWTACPIWLREGLAEHMGVVGSKDDPDVVAKLKQEVREARDVSIPALLVASDRDAWERSGGRAVSWALVRMMETSKEDFVPALFDQARRLMGHLAPGENAHLLPAEMREIVHGSLETSGAPDAALERAYTIWIQEGMPEKVPYKRTGAHRTLKKLRPPKTYGVQIKARFGAFITDEDGFGELRHWRRFQGAEIAWRLPWCTRMETWAGVRMRRTRIPRPRPRDAASEYLYIGPRWEAPPAGVKKIRSTSLVVPNPRTGKIGFVWVNVVSPVGLSYHFLKEYPLR